MSRSDPLLAAARIVAEFAFENGESCDHDGAFPEAEVALLDKKGLLAAPFAADYGGNAPEAAQLMQLLRIIGWGSLPLGRLYEGHVNAIALVSRYGQAEQLQRMADEARQGFLFGVWNTDDADGLRLAGDLTGFTLKGRKILTSGAGHILRPLVTALDEDGRRLMLTPLLDDARRADLSRWTAQGMRASATGTVDFTDVAVKPDEVIGNDGDYERQPAFSGGAWRFCAVHLGGMERLWQLLSGHLQRTGRGGDPHQAARLGQAGIALETARLWVQSAAATAEEPSASHQTEKIVAYVNLARLTVERCALDLIELVHRSVGLQSFMRPHPLERVARDLSTYLRQPGPDRALTNAAAWMLSQRDATDIWR